jgi:hypothetical protein
LLLVTFSTLLVITSYSINKVYLRLLLRWWLLFSPLAGRGGEERGGFSDMLLPRASNLTGLSSPVFVHGAGWPFVHQSGKLLRWEVASVVATDGSSFNKCKVLFHFWFCMSVVVLLLLAGRGGREKECGASAFCRTSKWCLHRLSGAPRAVFFLSAGHGGEGEDDVGSMQAGLRRCARELLEFLLPVAVPKRRRGFAAAIPGQRADPALLSSIVCSSSVFLHRRIIFSLGAPSQARAQPSGRVPGLGRSGCTGKLLNAGEKQGLDRFFATTFRVFHVNLQDLVVVSFFFQVLFVIVPPPPMK